MSKFDTHGGYFAPKDYMKVEAGGSHEENPNGGVQIGVDQEGAPNLLEEGEPVYKDYVYSDNIKASERFLKENNIPEKYAGELYSKIADSFFSEAENRPYDPISRNGLEAMLGRLADAQEGQKAYNEQRQLKRELESLSPDELAALEEMLAAGEQQAMEQQVVPVEPMQSETMQQPMMPEQQAVPEQMPMMRNGGRLFAAGGDTDEDDIVKQAVKQAYRERELEENDTLEERMRRATNVTSWLPGIPGLISMAGNALLDGDMAVDSGAMEARLGLFRPTAKQVAKKAGAKIEYNNARKVASDAIAESSKNIKAAKSEIKTAKDAFNAAKDALEYAAANNSDESVIKELSKTYDEAAKAISTARTKTAAEVLKSIGNRTKSVATVVKHPNAGKAALGAVTAGAGLYALLRKPNEDKVRRKEMDKSFKETGDEGVVFDDGSFSAYRYGGEVNKFDGENKSKMSRPWVGWPVPWSPANTGYTLYPTVGNGRQPSGAIGTYQTLQGYKWPGQLTVEDTVVPDPEEIILDPVVPPSPPVPAAKGVSIATPAAPIATVDEPISRTVYARTYGLDPSRLATSSSTIGGLVGERPVSSRSVTEPTASDVTDEITNAGNPYLSTFPRYAGAIGSGLLGLYNAFQRPDEYTATRYKPFTPSGRISLQDQVYNPVDQNMMMNQVLAQGNSAQRALRNSGLGPSTAAAMVAQDNNITGNLGNTFLQTWDANNQRRNQVIAANNQNEAQRAQFDYAIDAARQRALSEAQMRNMYTDLQIQQLNNEAEGAKYAAISNQISNALQALSGIGQENFAMNQVNSNPANEGYGAFSNGIVAYDPYRYNRVMGSIKNAGAWRLKCGGKMKK